MMSERDDSYVQEWDIFSGTCRPMSSHASFFWSVTSLEYRRLRRRSWNEMIPTYINEEFLAGIDNGPSEDWHDTN